MPIMLLTGAALFLAGGAVFLALLFSSGGASRSHQFEVLGHLWSGRLGAARRLLLMFSVGLTGLGALACFGGVAMMDAERAARCESVCQVRGFASGQIGASVDRSPQGRFVACTCTAPDRPPLELRADGLVE